MTNFKLYTHLTKMAHGGMGHLVMKDYMEITLIDCISISMTFTQKVSNVISL